jgi:hypothetical protein
MNGNRRNGLLFCSRTRSDAYTEHNSHHDDLNEFLEQALDQGLATESGSSPLALADSANGMVFLLITVLGLLMAIVYVPIRLFLTLTARSRRLKLLQKIRKLREEIGGPLKED